MNNDEKIKNYGDEDFHENRESASKSMKRSFSNRRDEKNRFDFIRIESGKRNAFHRKVRHREGDVKHGGSGKNSKKK